MFKKQFFSIVFWKSLVYLLGIISLLIVTPHLTSKPTIFGIYAFCSSITIFFSYADLGFITAARKFAAEFVAKKQLKAEIAVTSFSCLVFLLCCFPLSIGIYYFSYYPHYLIKGITETEIIIAADLLRILAFSFPILILQRIIQVIYSVRFADHIVFKFEIINIALRLISIYYFFSPGNYKIVEYFLFYNVLNLINIIALGYLTTKKFDYNVRYFFKAFRFRKSIYNKVSRLAFNSLFVSLAWLLFFEIDLVLITYLAGAAATAQYAIAFNVASILRNVLSTLYYPLTVKFNHLVVSGKEALSSFFYLVIKLGSYFLIPGIVVLVLFSKALIISWLGNKFEQSVIITQLLVFSYIFYPLSTPIGALLTTKLKMNILYANSVIYIAIQYLGLWIFYKSVDSAVLLALIKILCAGTGCIVLVNWLIKYLDMARFTFFYKVFALPISLSLLFSIVSYLPLQHVQQGKNYVSLFSNSALMVLSYISIVGLMAVFDKSFRTTIYKLLG